MHIKIDKFAGPLGLLLQLIEQEEMDITEVSLAKITDQYIEQIKNSPIIKPDDLADFLVVAAKLLLIKSKALLPYLYPEEEAEIEEFEEQLRMYQEFLAAAKVIDQIISKKKFMFAREFNRRALLAKAKIFSPPKSLTAKILAQTFRDLISKIAPFIQLEEKTLEYTINIEEKILAIQEILINRLKVSFSKVLASAKNKTEIIVSFLALLELIKQRDISVAQGDLFGEIDITRISNTNWS